MSKEVLPKLGHTLLFFLTLHSLYDTAGFFWLYCDSPEAFFFLFHVKTLIVILKTAIHLQLMIDKLCYA